MKLLKSFLFIPGDSEKKLAKVAGCGADAVILDLEDAVAPSAKDAARKMVAAFLRDFDRDAPGAPQLWVRVNPFDTAIWGRWCRVRRMVLFSPKRMGQTVSRSFPACSIIWNWRTVLRRDRSGSFPLRQKPPSHPSA
jgi:hypothetical protein